jgi:enterochelin esterase family protein
MPQVERDYRVLPGPANTAIAGASMGGGEALVAGLNHLNQFEWIGGFKAAGIFFDQQIPNLDASANSKLRLLWLACGDQDVLAGPTNERLRAWLTTKGIHFATSDYPGTHGWRADGKDTLAEFLTLLFRPPSSSTASAR